jgi:lipopolysaccharide transport system ATP-binding protein
VLRCVNVEKVYPIQSELSIWRTFLGIDERRRSPVIHALRDISLEVPKGKIVGILGRNGAGKSTLLRILGGVYVPTRGRVDTYGQVVGLFELGGVSNPHLTGSEYASRFLRIMGADPAELPDLLDEIKEFSELGEAFGQRIHTYSSGMAARLYFATATGLQHEIYLIDELLSVGDEHFQTKSWQRMRTRLLNGASGVLVTHDWTAIVKLCEIACVIEGGRFSFVGPSDRAVVSYLKLPVPEAGLARFSNRNPEKYTVSLESEDLITLWVELLEDAPIEFAISIEVLRIGTGWEIVVLADRFPVADKVGCYRVDVSTKNLPLVTGQYSMNVFLNRSDTGQGLDVKSWTYGNGYELELEGTKSKTAVKLPCVSRRIGEKK